ncbi:MAG: putative nucleotidyltransferase substrate binding domain-containing protein [Solirubrobacterales bacterium]
MHDIVEFLRLHPPFDDLDEATLEELARTVEVEFFAAGATIFRQGDEPMKHVRVVRRGAVELGDRGRVLDVLGEGEPFGHPSMLSGLPTGFEARAGEDALCYRLPAEAVVPLLGRPAGLRFVARSLLARPKRDPASLPANVDPAQKPAGSLIRGEPLISDPDTTVRESARVMSESGKDAVLVRLGGEGLGIFTDSDLRAVVADGITAEAPLREAMSAPAFTVTPERLGGEVMLEMLKRGIRHVPVVSPLGEVVGVLSDVDLLAAHTETPFALRRSIDDARNIEGVREAAARLSSTVVSLYDARVAPAQVSAIIAIVADACTSRFVELTARELGDPPCPLVWLALGSHGRRELAPSSDADSALAWEGDQDDAGQREYMQALADRVVGQLAATGFTADTHGATCAQPLFQRSVDSWRHLIRGSIEDPDEEKALVLLSLVADGRPVYSFGDARDLREELRAAHSRRGLLRLMLRLALVHRPPTGFRRFRDPPRDLVVQHSGEHRGQLDIKHGGLLPITAVARYASLATGGTVTSTVERLRLAGTAGTLDGGVATTLEEAFELFSGLRLEHQVEQIRRGAEPDNYIDPKALNPLTRRYLRDAFSAVRGVQRKLRGELSGEVAFG